MKNGKLFSKSGLNGFLTLFLFLLFSTCICYGGEVLEKRMIADKEYKIETVVGEPGNYWVSWGDEKMKWEPKPWYQTKSKATSNKPGYKEVGPMIYNTWEYVPDVWPWENPLEERTKWKDMNQVYMRSYPGVINGGAMKKDRCDYFGVTLESPKGFLRIKKGLEYTVNYGNQPDLIPKPYTPHHYYKNVWYMTFPEDIRGMSGLSINYFGDPGIPDTWFYSPTARKVRRMSAGSRGDSWVGTTLRNEDIAQTGLYSDQYKFEKFGLFNPSSDVYGMRGSKMEMEVPRIDGAGEPCWVVKCIHGDQPWWCETSIIWIGTKTLAPWIRFNYDKKGRLIRTLWASTAQMETNKQPYYQCWQGLPCEDLRSGFKSMLTDISEMMWFDTGFNQEKFFSERQLATPVMEFNHFEQPSLPDWFIKIR